MKKYAIYYLPRGNEDFAMKANTPNLTSAKEARKARDDWNTRMGSETVCIFVSENGKFPERLPHGCAIWRDSRYRLIDENHKGRPRISYET